VPSNMSMHWPKLQGLVVACSQGLAVTHFGPADSMRGTKPVGQRQVAEVPPRLMQVPLPQGLGATLQGLGFV
jgi:hypothetical protein